MLQSFSWTWRAALVCGLLTGCSGETFSTDATGGGSNSTGGQSAGGTSSGGTATGGASSGGAETGGSESGGSSSGAAAGSGGSSADDSCTSTIQCTLASVHCCPQCRVMTLEDYQAINHDQLESHRDELCGDHSDICPLCAEPPQNPNLFAACVQGTCEKLDLEQHPASECETASDCTLMPAACCECNAGNNPWEVIAINVNETQTFREAMCAGAVTTQCGDCLWAPPTGASAACVENRCVIEGLDGP